MRIELDRDLVGPATIVYKVVPEAFARSGLAGVDRVAAEAVKALQIDVLDFLAEVEI